MDNDSSGLRIIDVFQKRRFLTPCAADLLTRYAKRWQISGFESILDTQVFPEQTLANLIGESFKIDRIFNLVALEISQEAIQSLDYQVARANECLVTSLVGEDTGLPEVVFSDPSEPSRVAKIAQLLGSEITLAVAERSDIVRAIHGKYRLKDQLPILATGNKPKEFQAVKDL